ncbi:MAG: hypothetical protein ABI193_10750 [Minicystis sp.]
MLVALTGVLAACDPLPPSDPGKPAGTINAVEVQCNMPPDPSKTPPCPAGCKLDNGACVPDRGPPVHN